MIGKTKTGSGFKGTVQYCLQDKKTPEILDMNGISHTDKRGIVHEFVTLSSTNDNISKPVWHSSLSFPKEDKITDEKMIEIANRFMEKAGFSKENNQWLVIKHNDTKHTHCHIVANRVGFDGTTISDFYFKSRTVQYAKEIENEYGLAKVQEMAKERRAAIELNPTEAPNKEHIRKRVEALLKQPRVNSFEALRGELKREGIEMNVRTHAKTGKPYGVSFKMGETAYKGSDIGKQFAFKALNSQISPLNAPIPTLKIIKTAVKIVSKVIELGI
ncbi:MAG: relaxase/mobilization nuclease domain-containing protein [Bacteroidales bacterium]|nr:relaxase/mobilization nuclease domain-containing protein [Bacteroidales bacterium]